jgi:hypothetical protein
MSQKQTAQVELTVQEMGEAVAKYISVTKLPPDVFWNSYNLNIRMTNGSIEGITLTYYLSEEGQKQLEQRSRPEGDFIECQKPDA